MKNFYVRENFQRKKISLNFILITIYNHKTYSQNIFTFLILQELKDFKKQYSLLFNRSIIVNML